MNVSDFRAVADLRNSRVVFDAKTEDLKVTRQTFFNRTITWLRAKISPNPMAGAERDVAHNRFLRAIADHSGYDTGDVSRAEALLSVDILERRHLSSRRIREVFEDLDRRSTQATRDNRTTVAWMSSRGVNIRLAEQSPGVTLNEPERDVLAGRIRQAIHEAGGDGRRKVDFSDATSITNGIVDSFLNERVTHIAAEAPARADHLDATSATDSSAPEGHSSAQQVPILASSGATSRAVGPGDGHEGLSRKQLVRLLGRAKLRGNAKSELKKLIKVGQISDRASLARNANGRTADWILNNRIGYWYGEALKQQGAKHHIKYGEELLAPETMLRRVAQSIVGSADILDYPEAKTRSRALIAAHVRSELDGPASPQPT